MFDQLALSKTKMMRRTWIVAICICIFSSCSLTTPIAATSNPIGTKMGKSSGYCVVGICLKADASIMTAAKNGGITKISTVDYRRKNFLGIVQFHECIVSGE